MPSERLQKILASAGIASRRKAEELITSGLVTVNGQVITELGTKADMDTDHIKVDGKVLKGAERPVYIMLHKPKGHVTTVSDPEGRPTVLDLVQGIPERVFPVGRLDYLSEGLLLLTNDGELMQKLTHASSHVPKTYEVKIAGKPTEEELDKLRAGIVLPPEPSRAGTFGGTKEGMKRRSETVRTQPCEIQLVKEQDNPWYQVTLVEGRNRQIRRMFEEIGHHVEKIKRIRYGSLQLDIEPGHFRFLAPAEIGKLRVSANKPYKILPPRPRPAKVESAPAEEGIDSTIRVARSRTGKPVSERQRRAENKNMGDSRPPRAEGGFKPRENSERSERPRTGGYAAKREGGFAPKREGGYAAKREGGFAPKREGFTPREGGFKPRAGGFKPREDRDSERPRSGGYAKREGASERPKREGGFVERSERSAPRREDFKRAGGFKSREERQAKRPARIGGYTKPEGGFDFPKREGATRPAAFPKREGGFGGKREGGFAPKRESSAPREGGFAKFKPRTGGFKSRDEGSGEREERPRSGGFGKSAGGFGGKREGGFAPKREGFTPREGEFKPRASGFKPRGEGGSGSREERPRSGGYAKREGASAGPKRSFSRPKREGAGPRSGGDFKKRGSSGSARPSRPSSGRGAGKPKKDRS